MILLAYSFLNLTAPLWSRQSLTPFLICLQVPRFVGSHLVPLSLEATMSSFVHAEPAVSLHVRSAYFFLQRRLPVGFFNAPCLHLLAMW